jgi:peptidyl-tRNA hydrolase
MEVRIGVQQTAKEVVLNSDSTAEKVVAAVSKAIASGELLTLVDSRGRTVLVPPDRIAYVEVGPESERRVGFAAAE